MPKRLQNLEEYKMKVKELIKRLQESFDGDENVELDDGSDIMIVQRYDENCTCSCAIVEKEEE